MDPTKPEPPPAPVPWWLRLAGVLVGCVAAMLLAVVCAFYTPLRVGTVLVPVSVVLVVLGLIGILAFTRRVADHIGLTLLPGLAWLIVSLIFAGRRTEGDLVMVASWVSNVYLFAGSVTVGLVAYRMILPSRPKQKR